jgi:hypothetical protein
MFNLIVAVLSIALIGVTAGASVYYGGTAFSNSNNRGQAATLISSGGQIAAAQTLHLTERGVRSGAASILPTNHLLTNATDGLITRGYLASEPNVPRGLLEATLDQNWRLFDQGRIVALRIEASTTSSTSAAKLLCDRMGEEGGAYLSMVYGVAGGTTAVPNPSGNGTTAYPALPALVAGWPTVADLDSANSVGTAAQQSNWGLGKRVSFACIEKTGATAPDAAANGRWFVYRL